MRLPKAVNSDTIEQALREVLTDNGWVIVEAAKPRLPIDRGQIRYIAGYLKSTLRQAADKESA